MEVPDVKNFRGPSGDFHGTSRAGWEMSQYFPKPYEAFIGDINVKVDLSNYGTKADIKNISHVDTANFTLKQI